jgi:hypothetical protein
MPVASQEGLRMRLIGAIAIGLIVVAGLIAIGYGRAAAVPAGAKATPATGSTSTEPPDVAVPFGYKCAWLAIKGASQDAIVHALGLKDVRPCGWPEGINAAYRNDYFISPSIDGWILVVSRAFWQREGGPDQGMSSAGWVRTLSEKLDCVVQYYGTYRIVEYQEWVLAEKGHLRRAYCYVGESGEVYSNIGAVTPEEKALGLTHIGEDAPDEDFDARQYFPSEAEVTGLAAKWSVDVVALGTTGAKVGYGLLATDSLRQ